MDEVNEVLLQSKFRTELARFFLQSFDNQELHCFVRSLAGGSRLQQFLPDHMGVSFQTYAHGVVDLLCRHKLVDDDLFARLEQHFPRKKDQIHNLVRNSRHEICQQMRSEIRSTAEVLTLVSWIYARSQQRRRLGGLIGANLACVLSMALDQILTISLSHGVMFSVLGFLVGHKLPAMASGRRRIERLENFCMGVAAVEAANMHEEQKAMILSSIMDSLKEDIQITVQTAVKIGVMDPLHRLALTKPASGCAGNVRGKASEVPPSYDSTLASNESSE